MFTPLAELYQDEAIREVASCYGDIRRYDSTIEKGLERAGVLGTLATEAELLEHVEALPEYDWQEQRKRAARLLGCLPADKLLGDLGEEITAWTLVNDERFRVEHVADALADEGYDPVFLMWARRLVQLESKTPRGKYLRQQNAVMETVMGPAFSKVDTPGILQRSSQPNVTLSPKRLKDYELVPLQIDRSAPFTSGRVMEWKDKEKTERPGVYYSIWLDTPTGFALNYKGIPQVVVGLAANGESELQVRQLQRIYGKTYDPADPERWYTGLKQPRGLMPLDWQKAMIGATAELASILHLDSVGIIASKKVPANDQSRLTYAQAAEMYDQPANRLAFTRDDTGNWHKPVTALV